MHVVGSQLLSFGVVSADVWKLAVDEQTGNLWVVYSDQIGMTVTLTAIAVASTRTFPIRGAKHTAAWDARHRCMVLVEDSVLLAWKSDGTCFPLSDAPDVFQRAIALQMVGDRTYVQTGQSGIVMEDGRFLHELQLPNYSIGNLIVHPDDLRVFMVYFSDQACTTKRIIVWDAHGRLQTRTFAGLTPGMMTSMAVGIGGQLYVAMEKKIVGVNAAGSICLEFAIPDYVRYMTTDRTRFILYLCCNNDRVYAFTL